MDGVLKIVKLNKNVIIPTKGTQYSAGYDICSDETVIIPAGADKATKISTGLAMEIPFGYYGRIADRSSFASKVHISWRCYRC